MSLVPPYSHAPRDHHLTRLVVLNAHTKVHHSGPKDRNQVQILDSERTVPGENDNKEMQYLSTYGRPTLQSSATSSTTRLPSKRSSPFVATGVDFAGPFYVRYPGGSEVHKVWLCLFTCAIVRAVHLELVPDMSACTFRCSRDLWREEESLVR